MAGLTADLHTHTCYSHGRGTAEQNVCAAIEKGLSRIAITEHAGGHLFFGVRGEKLSALRRETEALKRKYENQIEVLFGLECNLTAFGCCDAPADKAGYDLLLLGYHKGASMQDALTRRALLEALGIGHAGKTRMAEALLAAAERYHIDIITHPGLYAVCDKAALAKGAAQLGCLLELNGQRLTFTDAELKTAYDAGAGFVINSDAHSPDRVGEAPACIEAAKRCNIADRVVNLKR